MLSFIFYNNHNIMSLLFNSLLCSFAKFSKSFSISHFICLMCVSIFTPLFFILTNLFRACILFSNIIFSNSTNTPLQKSLLPYFYLSLFLLYRADTILRHNRHFGTFDKILSFFIYFIYLKNRNETNYGKIKHKKT